MTPETLRRGLLAVLLLPGLALPVAAQDDDDDEKNPDDPTYSSFRITQARADFDNLDPAFNLGYTFGFRFPDFEFVGVEFDISGTISPGENQGAAGLFDGGGNDGGGDGGGGGILDPILGGGGGGGGNDGGGGGGDSGQRTRSGDELLVNTLGVYLRLETPRQWSSRFFASARVGYSYLDSTIPELVEDGRSQSAWGAGLGYRYGEDGRIELRYTRVAEDLDYLGIGFSF